MIEWIKIKNYKGVEDNIWSLDKNNLIIGENDAGKSTILECINIMLQNVKGTEKIETKYIRDKTQDVQIVMKVDGIVLLKTFNNEGKRKNKPRETVESDVQIVNIGANFANVVNEFKNILISEIKSSPDNEIMTQMQAIMQNHLDNLTNQIDKDFIVFDQENTVIDLLATPNWEKSVEITQKETNEIPIEGRGFGFQKNFLIALLASTTNSKIILTIDEIENSLSVVTIEKIIEKICNKTYQFICTSHSQRIFQIAQDKDFNIIGKQKNDIEGTNIIDIVSKLDSEKKSNFMLVEGKTDIPYFKKIIRELDLVNKFIVLPSGGSGNIKHLEKQILQEYGVQNNCLKIYDGDQKETITENASTIILNEKMIEYYCKQGAFEKIMGSNFNLQSFNNRSLEIVNKDKFYDFFASSADSITKLKNEIEEKIFNFLKK